MERPVFAARWIYPRSRLQQGQGPEPSRKRRATAMGCGATCGAEFSTGGAAISRRAQAVGAALDGLGIPASRSELSGFDVCGASFRLWRDRRPFHGFMGALPQIQHRGINAISRIPNNSKQNKRQQQASGLFRGFLFHSNRQHELRRRVRPLWKLHSRADCGERVRLSGRAACSRRPVANWLAPFSPLLRGPPFRGNSSKRSAIHGSFDTARRGPSPAPE